MRVNAKAVPCRAAMLLLAVLCTPSAASAQSAAPAAPPAEAAPAGAAPAAPVGGAPALPTPPPHYAEPPTEPPPRWDWSNRDPEPEGPGGLYTRVQLHLGLLARRGSTDGTVDTGGAALAIGYSLFMPRLVAFVQLDVSGDQSPRAAGVLFSDLGLAYRLESPRLTAALLLSGTNLSYTDPVGERQDVAGGGIGASLHHEWLLHGGPAAVGVGATLRFTNTDDRDTYAATLGVSFAYH